MGEIANGWTIGGRTRHVAIKCHFLQELVESGIIQVVYQKRMTMRSDLFTKNLAKADFEWLAKHFVGKLTQNDGKQG